MNKADFDQTLRQHVDELDKTKLPQRDLWPGIELALANEAAPNQIKQEEVRPTWQQPKLMALAATFAFVGLLSWFSLESA